MDPARGAGDFVRFLQEELTPFIEANYRTNGRRILCGQSFSSVLALYSFLRAPDAFDDYVLSSFGLSADWRTLFESELGRSPPRARPPGRLFVGNARVDRYDPDGSRTRNGLNFIESLRKATSATMKIKCKVYEEEGHVPFPTVDDALKWIYSTDSGVGAADPSLVSPPAADPVPGVVAEWALSPATGASDLAAERYLDGRAPTAIAWQRVRSEPSGLVDGARYRQPLPGGAAKIWARTTIASAQKEVRPYAFGSSNAVSLYVNGQILFRGQSGDRGRDPSPSGATDWSGTVYLPLEKGENELALMVSARPSGWDFMARDLDAVYRDPGVNEVWDIAGQLDAPESVAYDAARPAVYVSNFGGGFISKIGLDGSVLALRWVEGLKNPTGLKIFAGRLYAVERSGVAVIDPEKGVIVDREPVAGARFLNDLAIAADGAIYVTDTFRNCVFKLTGGKAEVWIEGPIVGQPNGILVEPDRLLVGVTEDGTIKTVDLVTKQVGTLFTLGVGANMDGLVGDGRGGYLFSDYYGRIYRGDAAGRKTLLLDRRGPHRYTADFEYIPGKGLLIVPSLYDHRLTAYTYGPNAP